MRSVLRGLVGFLVGTLLAYVGLIAFYATSGEQIFGWDRDGGKAMGFIFMLAPALSILAGAAAGLWFALRSRSRAA